MRNGADRGKLIRKTRCFSLVDDYQLFSLGEPWLPRQLRGLSAGILFLSLAGTHVSGSCGLKKHRWRHGLRVRADGMRHSWW